MVMDIYEFRVKWHLDDRWSDWLGTWPYTFGTMAPVCWWDRSLTRPPYTVCSAVSETWVYRSFRFDVLTLTEHFSPEERAMNDLML